ncbi:HsdM family class I SAM-dependent methyltransferase [Rhizobium laguerreae]|uniref:HsdM family class I SAM-dependent methyltransferase n=1 Tax=Rhizobium laguerreae TaxID=1076926 RepID=UPI001C910E3C|nr:N-6 DNA methylase [Rhizobium laguerreae]MBY3123219.1 SAM-dependent DNA methyltransferase [Rhizobium laguerreae]
MKLDDWLSSLAYTQFPDELFRAGETAGTRSYAAEIEEMLAPDRGIAAAAVFCVEEQPTVCFIDATTLTGDPTRRVAQIRQKVWNQNLASVVLVLEPEGLTAYSVSDRDAEPDILPTDDVHPRGNWSAYEIQSGFIRDRLTSWFSPEARVDQRLLANLRQVVKQIEKDGLSGNQAEALMAQVIFLCYLEQRGIVGKAYREAHELEVFEAYVTRQDGQGIDKLLRQLGNDFNGDFLASRAGGAPAWANLKPRSFKAVLNFLNSVDFETGQGAFWRYDFSHIPVELISGIYETLLKDRQGRLGAYYTPRHLANLVTEQAFESFVNPSQCTVYDGACGSGILLTTAFRKMLRHAQVRSGKRLRFQDRVQLMQDTIFGNDIDETACWITAFSLYLSLLEGLDEADISLLQSDANLKLPKLIGAGLNIQRGEVTGDFFAPGNPFAGKKRFDIFLCNPPWRESDDEERPTWEAWCEAQDPAYPIGRRQIAAGFAYRATTSVKTNGVIALIMPLNMVIGASAQSVGFRQRWLEEVRLERVINFGDVRRLLFAAAKHPCAIVRARPRNPDELVISLAEETVEYWTPKTDVSLALGRLALHAVDRKILSAREIYEKPYILISSYWGERRDIELLRKLSRIGTVGSTMRGREAPWLSGKGFHAPNNSNKDRSLGLLSGLAFLDADALPSLYPVIARDAQLPQVSDLYSVVASPGGARAQLYQGPRVIFPDGLPEELAIRAVYSDVPFAFTSSLGAIGGSDTDANLIKLLSVYLRSSLASYLLIMTGYSVIGERPRIALDDIETFPFCTPDQHQDPKRAREIVDLVARNIDRIGQEPEWQREHVYLRAKAEMDELILEYFCLTPSERILVSDAVKYVSASIQPADYQHLATPLLHKPQKHEIEKYVATLAAELIQWRGRDRGEGTLSVRAYTDGDRGFFGAVEVKVNQGQKDTATLVDSTKAFDKILADINAALLQQSAQQEGADFFNIPNIMVVSGNAFLFIKPLRRRFWLSRAALSDADHVVKTVHAAGWERRYA